LARQQREAAQKAQLAELSAALRWAEASIADLSRRLVDAERLLANPPLAAALTETEASIERLRRQVLVTESLVTRPPAAF